MSKKPCKFCLSTGQMWDEDNDEYLPCPKGCDPNDTEDLVEELGDEEDETDELLDDIDLFPDELPEVNKRKWG